MFTCNVIAKLTRTPISSNFVRHSSFTKKEIKWNAENKDLKGVRYEGVTYYPRHPDHVDPSFKPSKLLLVTRVKPFAGNPWWEKKTLENLGFINKTHSNTPVIVKNIPEICAMLWTVKHLVKIVPIKLPDKLPNPDDLNSTYLHENGTLYVIPRVDPARVDAIEKFMNDTKKLNRNLIQDKLRKQWLTGGILS